MTTSTYEFGCTVPKTRADEATTLARGIATTCRIENALYHGLIGISENAVHNGSGDLRWINWEARVTDATYTMALGIASYLNGLGLDVGVSENLPADFNSYGMYTRAGTDEVKQLIAVLEQGLREGTIPAQHLAARVETEQHIVAGLGHTEVHDTAVREVIWEKLDRVLADLGIQLLDA